MKLSEFYPEYMSSCDSLRASTRVGYESAYRVHLQAAFGDVELLNITVQRVESVLQATNYETTARYYLVPHVEAYKEAQRKYERFLLAS